MPIELEVYVRDEQGVRYRVHDAAFGPPLAAPGKRKLLPLGDSRARYRLFVPADGDMIRTHDFTRKGGDRGISAEILGAQFQDAGFTPKHPRRPALPAPGTKLGQ